MREQDVGADPVLLCGRVGSQPVGQSLGDPPLDTAGGYGDDLRGERVGERRGEEVA